MQSARLDGAWKVDTLLDVAYTSLPRFFGVWKERDAHDVESLRAGSEVQRLVRPVQCIRRTGYLECWRAA